MKLYDIYFRCDDSTEFGTDFSAITREGKLLRPKNPLDQEAPWVSKDGSVTVPSYQIAEEMQEIGAELALLQLSKLEFFAVHYTGYLIANIVK